MSIKSRLAAAATALALIAGVGVAGTLTANAATPAIRVSAVADAASPVLMDIWCLPMRAM